MYINKQINISFIYHIGNTNNHNVRISFTSRKRLLGLGRARAVLRNSAGDAITLGVCTTLARISKDIYG